MATLYIRLLQIPVCMLLLVQLPLRNQLCLMEFLIVCPGFESLELLEILRSASDERRREEVSHLFPRKALLCLTLEILKVVFF